MSAKHFIAICKVLRYHRDSLDTPIYRELIADLARSFAEFNPRFNVLLFAESCGETQEVK